MLHLLLVYSLTEQTGPAQVAWWSAWWPDSTRHPQMYCTSSSGSGCPKTKLITRDIGRCVFN